MYQRYEDSKILLFFFVCLFFTADYDSLFLHKFGSQLLFKEVNIPRHPFIFHTDSYLYYDQTRFYTASSFEFIREQC